MCAVSQEIHLRAISILTVLCSKYPDDLPQYFTQILKSIRDRMENWGTPYNCSFFKEQLSPNNTIWNVWMVEIEYCKAIPLILNLSSNSETDYLKILLAAVKQNQQNHTPSVLVCWSLKIIHQASNSVAWSEAWMKKGQDNTLLPGLLAVEKTPLPQSPYQTWGEEKLN